MRTALIIASLVLLGCDQLPEDAPPKDPVPTVPPSDAELLAARSYQLQVPPQYDAGTAWPLMLVLHGYGGMGEETETYWQLDDLIEARGMFIVAPNGLKDRFGNRGWHPEKSSYPEWDRSWLSAIIHDVKAKYAIDPKRVYVFGHSQGAHMAHRMGCDGSAEVTGVISAAGQVTMKPEKCAPEFPVTVLQVHGTADEAIGYEGDVQHDPPDRNVPSAHQTVAVWARNDGCTGALEVPAESPIDLSLQVTGRETKLEQYAGCPHHVAVALWSMQDATHRPEPVPIFARRVLEFVDAWQRD